MPPTPRPAPPSHRTPWAAPKRQRSLSLTDAAWASLTAIAEHDGVTRSEVCERLFRTAAAEV